MGFANTVVFSQCDCKVNMSFERAEGGCFGQDCNCNCLPDNGQDSWEQCKDWGCGSTDIEPGGNLTIGNISPSDGKTFMSMTCGPNGEGNSLKLCAGAPLKAGTQYCFSIDLLTKGGSTALALYGATSACTTSQLLWKSATITAATWSTQTFCFTPTSDWTYISFRVVEGSGALGVDNWKSTDGKFPPQPDQTACGPKVVVRDTSVCANGCTKLTAIGSGGTPGYTYKWSDGQTGATIDVCPGTSTKTWTVVLTDKSNKTATDSANVNIVAAPVVKVNPVSICEGATATLTASGAATYRWSPSTGLNTTTGAVVTARPATTTTYTVVGSIAEGCADTTTVVVTVMPKPDVQTTGGTICKNDSVKLSATNALTYVWSPAATLINSNTATPLAYPSVTTTYTVIGTATNGCKDTTTAIVQVVNNITPVVTGDTIICKGGSTQLTASGGSSYSWSPGTGLSDSTIANPVASPIVTTTYQVFVSSGSCKGMKSISIKVNPLPVVSATSLTICENEEATLTATGALTYTWSGGGITPVTSESITVKPEVTTMYSVVGTDVNGCSDDTTIAVTVNKLPVVSVNNDTICKGEEVTLIASGAASYSWSSSAGGTFPQAASIIVKPEITGTYTVTGTAVNGCKNAAVATIIVNPIPDVAVNSGVMCKGNTFTLKAVGASTNSYTWQASDGSQIPNKDVVVVSPLSSSTYTVTGSSKGCMDTAIAHVAVNEVPVIAVNNAAICSRSEVLLTATGGTSYVWSTGGTTPTIVVTPFSTTSYTVTGTVAGCSSTAVSLVTVYGNPDAQFYLNPRELSEDQPTLIILNSSKGKNLMYAWDFGDPESTENASTATHPTHEYSHPGKYSICLKVIDSLHGCSDSTCKEIVYKPQWTFYIPNAFTPGDKSYDLNNVFYAYGTNILKFRMMIFDRWGTKIFESNDLQKGWDGCVQGKSEVAQQDVYVWKVDLTDPFNKEHHYIGHVTLLK